MNFTPLSPEDLEKYSSAVSLSDMEIFIFPELLYSLVLANIMSPRIWQWKNDPWFKKLDRMSPYRRVLRLKQYIIDHYEFNLDLDTWGLTTQEKEIKRFEAWIDPDTLSRSNALFGYEGDKYYFDLDIRKHFGLDQYTGNVIPYWKTETLEAMDAFRHKEAYRAGAGECVSLSTLYAAALFVVCEIPLEDIFLLATPLHSQNFVRVNDGILTNNRRVVTKNMWFNGTELTDKAQRALRHEQVTIVANNTGHVHVMYPEASIDHKQYSQFKAHLEGFLHTPITFEVLANFLRVYSKLLKCFQVRHDYHGKSRFIAAETVYAYEHTSAYRMNDQTRDKLLESIDEYEFYYEPLPDRILLNDFSDFLRGEHLNLDSEEDCKKLREKFCCVSKRAPEVIEDLIAFTHIDPRFPDEAREHRFVPGRPIELKPGTAREDIVNYLQSVRSEIPVADLAFYAYRDLAVTDWMPFLRAALERNPVCVGATQPLADQDLASGLDALENESVYDSTRAAQPDEVWNFQRGDGLEKAFCLAAIWRQRHPGDALHLLLDGQTARLRYGENEARFSGCKGLSKELTLP